MKGELEAEVVDALRTGPSPVHGIAERVPADGAEVLDLLLDLEHRGIVRRRDTRGVPALGTWWELTSVDAAR